MIVGTDDQAVRTVRDLLAKVLALSPRAGGIPPSSHNSTWQNIGTREGTLSRVMCPGIKDSIIPEGELFLPASFVVSENRLKSCRLQGGFSHLSLLVETAGNRWNNKSLSERSSSCQQLTV
jgi:hypothetical protein